MFLNKTSELVKRFTAAAARYEVVQKNVEAMRSRRQKPAPVEYAYEQKP
jgi:hypothetical protein